MGAPTPTRPADSGRLAAVAGVLAARGAEAAVVVGLLATAVFLSLRVLPGDPAALVLGDLASEAERMALRERLDLQRPLVVQYALFWRRLVVAGGGESLRHPGRGAGRLVAEALGPTASLAFLAVAIGAVAGVGAALLASGPWLGERKHWVPRGAAALAATPLLSFAPLFTYAFAAKLRVVPLPGDPASGAAGLAFAASLLALPLAAHVARMGHAALTSLGRSQFLQVAAAKGGSSLRVWVLHALPAAAAPVLTVLGAQLGALLGGAVVLERLFERPGLGSLILAAYASRDLPVLEMAVVAAGVLFVVAQMLAAGAVAVIDPRVRR